MTVRNAADFAKDLMQYIQQRSWMIFCLTVVMMTAMSGHRAVGGEVGPGARLFVTKVYPRHGRLSDADFRQLADAGFTVVVNMWLEDVPAYCRGAARVGLAAMTWNAGLADAAKGDEVDRTVTRQGKTTRYTLPFSKAGWDEITKVIVAQARLSLTYRNLKGALLDFEIYDANSTDGFCESYDDATFAGFLREGGRTVPSPLPPPAKRQAYLDKLQILPLYIESQAKRVGERALALRRAVDAVNPDFQIGVYGWGAFKESILRNVASERAPALDMDATLYGRTIYSNAFSGGYDGNEPDRKGLKWSLTTAQTMAQAARHRGYPVVILAGHYPQSPGPADGSQYRFTVRQSFNSAAYADGYWIWTDWWLPKPWTDKQAWIDAMMTDWTQANAALDAGDWTWASRQPESVKDPHATTPQVILTTDGKKVKAWDAISGKSIAASAAIHWPQAKPAGSTSESFRVRGWRVEEVKAGKVIASYEVGHGVRAVATGDVDGLPGDEVITLNGGWIKIWDPQSQCELLRFYVGADQQDVRTVEAAAIGK